MLRWRGQEARRLIDSGVLPLRDLIDGALNCDKSLVRELALAGLSVRSSLERREQRTRQHLDNHEVDLLHWKLTSILFDYQGHHFAESEITCLVMLRHPWITEQEIRSSLEDLVRWNIVQRIKVGSGMTFFDTDVRPHLHTYDAKTRQLQDAPSSGVLRLDSNT